MNADKLRALQTPLKERYRLEPGTTSVTLHASERIGHESSHSHNVDAGTTLMEGGLPTGTGNGEREADAAELLLQALAVSAGATLRAVAASMGIELRNAVVHVEGRLDLRGTLGMAREVPVGFKRIRLQFDLDADASNEQLTTLVWLAERQCVVLQTMRGTLVPEVLFNHLNRADEE